MDKLRNDPENKFFDVIDMDVDRTYKATKYFNSIGGSNIEVFQKKLQNILYAYAIKNKKVG